MNKLVNNNECVFNYSIYKLIFDLFARNETNNPFDPKKRWSYTISIFVFFYSLSVFFSYFLLLF